MMRPTGIAHLSALAMLAAATVNALDLSNAHLETQGALTGPERKAVEMLTLEVDTRTGLN